MHAGSQTEAIIYLYAFEFKLKHFTTISNTSLFVKDIQYV